MRKIGLSLLCGVVGFNSCATMTGEEVLMAILGERLEVVENQDNGNV